MTTLAHRRMTVDEFLAWAEGQEGRWELYNGVPFQMAPERPGHVEVKYAVQTEFLRAIRKAGVPCHMLADGLGVRISQYVMHVPDALIYCGTKLPRNALEVPNPVVIAEVASPSTGKLDDTVKVKGYFSLPSVRHYLIVDPDGPPVVHYCRGADGALLRTPIGEGTLVLSPPGIVLSVAELLAEP